MNKAMQVTIIIAIAIVVIMSANSQVNSARGEQVASERLANIEASLTAIASEIEEVNTIVDGIFYYQGIDLETIVAAIQGADHLPQG